MKKFINDATDVVGDALRGMAAAHQGQLRIDLGQRVVYRATAKEPGMVALVSGGGSGHEPLHGGFVGHGMLDAACVGEIFTSPVPDQVVAATRAVERGAGVLHIVKNYSGDVMNFEMAAEIAGEQGIRVARVTTDDDVALGTASNGAGRRGVGVTVLLEKIVGAAAEQGRDLAALVELGRRINGQGRSLGVALSGCTVPDAGRPTVELADDEMELGIGIHGEPGRERLPVARAREVAEMLVEPVLADHDFTGSPVICFVNGMGATPLLEQYVMYDEISRLLARRGVGIARSLVGSYITSLDMAGCSLTLLGADDDLLTLWDAPVATPGLRWAC